MILAGSRSMLGAPALCALAAMRTGAGLVTVGIPRGLNTALQKKLSPVIMTQPLPATALGTLSSKAFQEIKKGWNTYQVIALGPGLTQHQSTVRLVHRIIAESPVPLVIDADGLNAVAKKINCLGRSHTVKILTPHPGEMRRLTGMPAQDIRRRRRAAAADFARRHNVFLVLKGNRTIVAGPDGQTAINPTGNPGMATAGSGDVLTGMIAALTAQGIAGFEAARWGVRLHGKAGDLAADDRGRAGMIATDIIESIPAAMNEMKRAKA